MKKIFTLLFAVGIVSIATAQPGRDNRNGRQPDVVKVIVTDNDRHDNDRYDNDGYGNNNFGNERRMKMKIAEINREYDYKIQKVRNNFFMSRWEKQRQVSILENLRQREIRSVYAKFKNNRYDRDYPTNRRY